MDVGEEVRAIVVAIPKRAVVTYGQIGHVVGTDPRQAGRIVSRLDDDVRWWRVVYAGGTPPTCNGGVARALHEAEGVSFLNGHVDMKKFR